MRILEGNASTGKYFCWLLTGALDISLLAAYDAKRGEYQGRGSGSTNPMEPLPMPVSFYPLDRIAVSSGSTAPVGIETPGIQPKEDHEFQG
jgi:hypothetical protein